MSEEIDPIKKAEYAKESMSCKEQAEQKLKDGDVNGATNTIKEAAKSLLGADSMEIYLSYSVLFLKIAEAVKEDRKKKENISNNNIRLYESGEFNDRLFSLYASAALMAKKGGNRRAIVDINSTYRIALGDYMDLWDKVFMDILKDTT